MAAFWKNLEEPQRREVATLLGSFYDESCCDHNKEALSISNLKKYLNKTNQAARWETSAVSLEFSGPREDIRGSRRKVGGQ